MTRQEQLSCLTDRPCAVCKHHTDNGCYKWKCVFEEQPEIEQPCEDAISRHIISDYVESHIQEINTGYGDLNKHTNEILRMIVDYIEKMESVTPQPKTGHWITQWNVAHQKEYYYCSECREEYSYDGETGIKINNYKFCPNCGCRMVEPQESEGKG